MITKRNVWLSRYVICLVIKVKKRLVIEVIRSVIEVKKRSVIEVLLYFNKLTLVIPKY